MRPGEDGIRRADVRRPIVPIDLNLSRRIGKACPPDRADRNWADITDRDHAAGIERKAFNVDIHKDLKKLETGN
jgi:hypothetical protein